MDLLWFWGDVVLTAGHLINWMPSLVFDNQIPLSILFPMDPIYSILPQVFGCICFVHNLSPGRDKLSLASSNVFSLAILSCPKGLSVLLSYTSFLHLWRYHVLWGHTIFYHLRCSFGWLWSLSSSIAYSPYWLCWVCSYCSRGASYFFITTSLLIHYHSLALFMRVVLVLRFLPLLLLLNPVIQLLPQSPHLSVSTCFCWLAHR